MACEFVNGDTLRQRSSKPEDGIGLTNLQLTHQQIDKPVRLVSCLAKQHPSGNGAGPWTQADLGAIIDWEANR